MEIEGSEVTAAAGLWLKNRVQVGVVLSERIGQSSVAQHLVVTKGS